MSAQWRREPHSLVAVVLSMSRTAALCWIASAALLAAVCVEFLKRGNSSDPSKFYGVDDRGDTATIVESKGRAPSVPPDGASAGPSMVPASSAVQRRSMAPAELAVVVKSAINAGDSSRLSEAKEILFLNDLCSDFSWRQRSAPQNVSDSAAVEMLQEACTAISRSIGGQLDGKAIRDYLIQNDPAWRMLEDLAGERADAQSNLSRKEREDFLHGVLMEANSLIELRMALGLFALVTRDPASFNSGDLPLPYLEGLPGMGGKVDYRSYRFLDLVAYRLFCELNPFSCGANGFVAVDLCKIHGTCRNGYSVHDYFMMHYSGRDLNAAMVAARRIISARVAWRASRAS